MRDFVHNFKFQRSITVHAPVADVLQTRMTTKRVSALLSEASTFNRAFTGDQRGLVQEKNGELTLDRARLEPLLDHVQTLVLGPLLLRDGQPGLADPMALLTALRHWLELESVILFTDNPLSPLAAKKPVISQPEDRDRWLNVYDEERESIDRAWLLRPAQLCSPVNFAR